MLIALDLSLANTGVCLFDGSYKTLSISTSPKDGSQDDRIERIRKELSLIIDRHDIEYCILEKVPPVSRFNADVLHGLNFVIRNMLIRKRIDFELVFPNVWQKSVLGKSYRGSESKKQSLSHAKKLADVKNHDEADAVCLMEYLRSKKDDAL